MRWSTVAVVTLIMPIGMTGCVDSSPTQVAPIEVAARKQASIEDRGRHLVVFATEQVPTDFSARVSSLGGVVDASHDAIGVVTVSGLSESAAAELALSDDVRAVEPSVFVAMSNHDFDSVDLAPPDALSAPADATATISVMTSPTSAQFYARQWNMQAIHAPEAWAAGHLGSTDVVVAIIDTGIDYLHPDLVGLVDLTRSISFVPEEDPIIAARFPGRLPISDLAYHGTAVASVVATNGVLLAGVNQKVTFIAVKAFNRFLAGTLDRTISGILYAADQGVDVINLSAAFSFNKNESPGTIAAFQRAVNYAFRKGALLVAPAGNDAVDLQHNGNRVRLPCEAAHAICVHATGPTGAAGLNGPWQNIDASADYSAYGRSAITVAAPGGAGAVGSGRRLWVICSRTTIGNSAPACLAGQPVAQPAATSFAAPHVTGLAALLVNQLGKGQPALIRARILQSADDLGDPGVDAFYGHGRINVARALGLIQ
jgi:lantibiotic leader peptide-processing serine protease